MTDVKAELPPDSDESASSAAFRLFSRWPLAAIGLSVLATLLWTVLLGWLLMRALIALL